MNSLIQPLRIMIRIHIHNIIMIDAEDVLIIVTAKAGHLRP